MPSLSCARASAAPAPPEQRRRVGAPSASLPAYLLSYLVSLIERQLHMIVPFGVGAEKAAPRFLTRSGEPPSDPRETPVSPAGNLRSWSLRPVPTSPQPS